MTAEELGKSKWIKSVSKEKVSVLRELILRYDAWAQGGGTRQSLAEPLDWEQDEENECVYIFIFAMNPSNYLPISLQNPGLKEQNPWQFDTVRGRPMADPLLAEPESFFDTAADEAPSLSTARPRGAQRLPSSLRGLFDEEASSSEPELFRPPTLQVPGLRSTPSPPSSSPSPSPSRDRTAYMRTLTADSTVDDLQTAKQANFAFPPKTSTPRNKSKLSTSVPGSEDEEMLAAPVSRKGRPPPLGLGTPSTPPTSSTSSTNDLPDGSRENVIYREFGVSHDSPDIETPSVIPPDTNFDFGSTNSLVAQSSSVPTDFLQVTPTSRPPANRKRSQSSVTGIASRTALASQRDRSLASPVDFQFPLPSNNSPLLPTVLPLRTHNKASTTHTSISSTSGISPIAHQATYSLDASVSSPPSRRPPLNPLSVPQHTINRAHSANALSSTVASTTDPSGSGLPAVSRKPSLNRQASVAVMESVQPPPPLLPPTKPFARPTRDRSGSGASRLSDGNISGQSLSLPGLKDVLKVNYLDLLRAAANAHVGVDTCSYIRLSVGDVRPITAIAIHHEL